MKPKIALIMGDPCGIGPEISIKALSNPAIADQGQFLVIGNQAVWALGQAQAALPLSIQLIQNPEQFSNATAPLLLLETPHLALADCPLGHVSAAAGRFVLQSLQIALDLAQAGQVDGICFAPLNKQAMHLGGLEFEDELRFFTHYLEHDGSAGELNILDDLCTSRVTSHVPLSAVSQLITQDKIVESVTLVHTALQKVGNGLGNRQPKIAVAGLNPHAGEGGSFGREEIDLIAPAIAKAVALGIDATGPYSPDTIFRRARDGEFDAVVTMYHDQGQIAMKLLGFEKGITVHSGLPFPISTPAHGTAFDIAGTGRANAQAMERAIGYQLSAIRYG